jgi:gas vesicle protein
LCNDIERKFQEDTRTVGGTIDALNEGTDTHVVATRKVTGWISQEMNARSGRLLDDMKQYRTEAENSLKEFRQHYSLSREQVNSEQANWQNKAEEEMDKVNDSVRLVEERVARLVEDRVTEIQVTALNSILNVNTEMTYLREQLAARQLTEGAIYNQVLPVTDVDVENSSH